MASADMDDATFALIQQMLADDNPYAASDGDAGEPDSGSDSDYGLRPSQKKRKAKQSCKRTSARCPRHTPRSPTTVCPAKPRKRTSKGQQASNDENAPAADTPTSNAADTPSSFTASGRRVRKDKGKERAKARAWDDAEEAKFVEALHLYGRDWKKCAQHVGTRDPRAITSHAQKYFIKLCLQGKRLPRKVAESGDGYTLSGKPLDPNSAAARAYGFKPDSLQQIQNTDAASGVVLADGAEPGENEAVGNDSSEPADASHHAPAVAGDNTTAAATDGADAPPAPTVEATPTRRARAQQRKAPPTESPALGGSEPTEYARNRPKREVKQRHVFGQTTESLQLMKCVDFVGPIASGAALAQPFRVVVSSQAALLMDLHSHLSSCEIIGLLGGRWDTDAKTITVVRAYPCQRVEGSHSLTSVELDPAAEVATRTLMEAQGLVPVGWYHSHPIFEPIPSAKDAENQRNYQALFSSEGSGAAPFLGAIVGPYDRMLPSENSSLKWFVVRQRGGELVPYNVVAEFEAPLSTLGAEDEAALNDVVTMLKDDIGRIDLTEMWRPFRRLEGGLPSGGPCTKLAKLRAALSRYLAVETAQEELAAEALLDRVSKHIQTAWALDLGY